MDILSDKAAPKTVVNGHRSAGEVKMNQNGGRKWEVGDK